MRVDLDLTELGTFSNELVDSADDALSKGRAIVARGALNVKRTMQADLAGSQHFGQVARDVSYDTRVGTDWVEAEIGPTSGGAGSLANIAYFGTSRGGGTVRDPQEPLNEEAPGFEQALLDLIG